MRNELKRPKMGFGLTVGGVLEEQFLIPSTAGLNWNSTLPSKLLSHLKKNVKKYKKNCLRFCSYFQEFLFSVWNVQIRGLFCKLDLEGVYLCYASFKIPRPSVKGIWIIAIIRDSTSPNTILLKLKFLIHFRLLFSREFDDFIFMDVDCLWILSMCFGLFRWKIFESPQKMFSKNIFFENFPEDFQNILPNEKYILWFKYFVQLTKRHQKWRNQHRANKPY